MRIVLVARQGGFTQRESRCYTVRMKKLGESKTVRVFVPMPVEMRDKFRAAIGNDSGGMAEAIRELVAERINQAAGNSQNETHG